MDVPYIYNLWSWNKSRFLTCWDCGGLWADLGSILGVLGLNMVVKFFAGLRLISSPLAADLMKLCWLFSRSLTVPPRMGGSRDRCAWCGDPDLGWPPPGCSWPCSNRYSRVTILQQYISHPCLQCLSVRIAYIHTQLPQDWHTKIPRLFPWHCPYKCFFPWC